MCIWTATVMAFSSHCFLSLLLLLLMNGSVGSPMPRVRGSALLSPIFPILPAVCYKSAEAVKWKREEEKVGNVLEEYARSCSALLHLQPDPNRVWLNTSARR